MTHRWPRPLVLHDSSPVIKASAVPLDRRQIQELLLGRLGHVCQRRHLLLPALTRRRSAGGSGRPVEKAASEGRRRTLYETLRLAVGCVGRAAAAAAALPVFPAVGAAADVGRSTLLRTIELDRLPHDSAACSDRSEGCQRPFEVAGGAARRTRRTPSSRTSAIVDPTAAAGSASASVASQRASSAGQAGSSASGRWRSVTGMGDWREDGQRAAC